MLGMSDRILPGVECEEIASRCGYSDNRQGSNTQLSVESSATQCQIGCKVSQGLDTNSTRGSPILHNARLNSVKLCIEEYRVLRMALEHAFEKPMSTRN